MRPQLRQRSGQRGAAQYAAAGSAGGVAREDGEEPPTSTRESSIPYKIMTSIPEALVPFLSLPDILRLREENPLLKPSFPLPSRTRERNPWLRLDLLPRFFESVSLHSFSLAEGKWTFQQRRALLMWFKILDLHKNYKDDALYIHTMRTLSEDLETTGFLLKWVGKGRQTIIYAPLDEAAIENLQKKLQENPNLFASRIHAISARKMRNKILFYLAWSGAIILPLMMIMVGLATYNDFLQNYFHEKIIFKKLLPTLCFLWVLSVVSIPFVHYLMDKQYEKDGVEPLRLNL